MLRRSYLSLLSVLPTSSIIPEELSQSNDPPALPNEGDMWFWYYFFVATTREQVLTTEGSRKHVVNEMDLTTLSDAEALRILELASNVEYETDDMPDRWQRMFDKIDQVEFV